MIYKNRHSTTALNHNRLSVSAVYKGARLVWQKLQHLSAWFRSEGYFRSEPW